MTSIPIINAPPQILAWIAIWVFMSFVIFFIFRSLNRHGRKSRNKTELNKDSISTVEAQNKAVADANIIYLERKIEELNTTIAELKEKNSVLSEFNLKLIQKASAAKERKQVRQLQPKHQKTLMRKKT